MQNHKNRGNQKKNIRTSDDFRKNRLFADVTKKDIEKSYNIESTEGTEAYYSNRYGWTLRRAID